MKLLVISSTRVPAGPTGSFGIGRSAHDIATGLAEIGWEVTLIGGIGSKFTEGPVVEVPSDRALYTAINRIEHDIILDTSHKHFWSTTAGSYSPVLNRIADRECEYQPPNAVVNSQYMQHLYPQAELVHTGVETDHIMHHPTAAGYAVFLSSRHRHKGWPEVVDIAEHAGIPLRTASNLNDEDFWDCLGNASVLLHPSTIDAAPRLPLEAAAAGVPTLCLSDDGASQHVAHGLTGFVSVDYNAIIKSVNDALELDRGSIRQWVIDTHSYSSMVQAYDTLLHKLSHGERW